MKKYPDERMIRVEHANVLADQGLLEAIEAQAARLPLEVVIEADPAAPDFAVPDIVPPLVIEADRVASRRELLARVDRFQRGEEAKANRRAATVDAFRSRAFDLMTSPEAKKAFDIKAEPEKLRNEYGRNTLGQSCLMARRLVEAGDLSEQQRRIERQKSEALIGFCETISCRRQALLGSEIVTTSQRRLHGWSGVTGWQDDFYIDIVSQSHVDRR